VPECAARARLECGAGEVAINRVAGRDGILVGFASSGPGQIQTSAMSAARAALRCMADFWRCGEHQSNFYPISNVDMR
jgi:hypothetical protein